MRVKGRTDLVDVLKVKIEQFEVSKAQRGQWLGVCLIFRRDEDLNLGCLSFKAMLCLCVFPIHLLENAHTSGGPTFFIPYVSALPLSLNK